MIIICFGSDSASIQRAINTCASSGGGSVYLPGRNYTIDHSIDQRGMSNIEVFGDGPGRTILTCTAALNGSDPNVYNDVFNANNLTVKAGGYPRGLVWRDMTIDCTLQNASGVPQGQQFGFNLCAIEAQNVDSAQFVRLKVINAFGNALVSGSIDPTLPGAVAGAVIDDCEFDGCVGGILPQYGITGSVVQYGAMKGGAIRGCRFINSGGPAIDWFNCYGTEVRSNSFTGQKGTPIGSGQTVNSIHSDFGLQACVIADNQFLEAGGIYLNGLMVATPFNVNPTPGPWHCTIRGNKLYGMSAANATFAHITIIGGSAGALVGNATSNVIDGNMSYQAPRVGIELIDGTSNSIVNNTVEQCGAVPFAALDSGVSGGGSQDNRFQGNQVIGGTLTANYQDNSVRNVGNRFWDSRIELIANASAFAAQSPLDTRGLYGPGAP